MAEASGREERAAEEEEREMGGSNSGFPYEEGVRLGWKAMTRILWRLGSLFLFLSFLFF